MSNPIKTHPIELIIIGIMLVTVLGVLYYKHKQYIMLQIQIAHVEEHCAKTNLVTTGTGRVEFIYNCDKGEE